MSNSEHNTEIEISEATEPNDILADLPTGPLDRYRKMASFDWKSLRVALEGMERLKLKIKVWNMLESDPEFQRSPGQPSSEEYKRKMARQLIRLHQLKYNVLPSNVQTTNYKRKTSIYMIFNEAVAMYDKNLSIKFALGVSLFSNALVSLGTERHLKFSQSAWSGDLLSCFAITEIAHGSNTKKLRTVATYDPHTKQFVIHTPDFEAAKCWVGNLGRQATHAMVFAQLKTSDNENHGLHAFMVPIRDPQNLQPYPGVTVGDMGEKIGLHGIDNGFVMFHNYRIPKENLLNRTGDVNDEGWYESSFTNPQQILGAALENLSAGRVAIAQECVNSLSCGVTIAVRYSAVRVQFGPTDDVELSLIEYPLHQWRIFPYLAAACVFRVFVTDFTDEYLGVVEKSTSTKLHDLSLMVSEIHAVVSSLKPLVSWTCHAALQECREACGGHGFLNSANLGNLRSDNEPTITYEGDNNVLIQQTSNWLLRQWGQNHETVQKRSPLGTLLFLSNSSVIRKYKFIGDKISDVISDKFISSTYQWLLCWLLSETDSKMSSLLKQDVPRFIARSHCQIYRARTLSLVFAEYNALVYFWKRVNFTNLPSDLRLVLEKLYFIYGLWCLDKHLPYLYQGGFANGSDLSRLLRDALVQLCSDLKSEAVAIVDALAPPDFILNSVLGMSDGKVYQHLQKSMFERPGATDRASWWKEIVPSVASKL